MVDDWGPNVPRLCPGLNELMPLPDHKHNALHSSACGRDNRVRHYLSRRGTPKPRSSSLTPEEGPFMAQTRSARTRLSRQQFGDEQTRLNGAPTAQVARSDDYVVEFWRYRRRCAAPVVLPPTVAFLGAARIRAEPVVVEGAILARRVLPLSLTFDDRAG